MIRTKLLACTSAIAVAASLAFVSATPAAAVHAAPPFTEYTSLSSNIPKNTLAVVGDFDGDDIDDILWYGFGSITDKFWKGKANGGFTSFPLTIGGQYEPLTGDFDGDTFLDIFWYTPGSGADYIWFGNGTAGTTGTTQSSWFTAFARSVGGSYRPLLADFDGDDHTDILWYAPGTGTDTFWFGTSARGFTAKSVVINGTYDYVTGGDFQGDGDLDLLWWKQSSTVHPVWLYNGGSTRSYTSSSLAGPGPVSVPMVMKIDNDLIDDILWYGDGSALDAVALGPAYTKVARAIGGRYAPLWGNFDGDNSGYDDVLWWGYLPSASDAFWAGNGTTTLTSVSMAGLSHYDYDTHAPLLGYFGANEPLDVIFHDSQPGGTSGFMYGVDDDGISMARRSSLSGLRGRVCSGTAPATLRLRCTQQQ